MRRKVRDRSTRPAPSMADVLGSGTVVAKNEPEVLRTTSVGLAAISAAEQVASAPQKNCATSRGVVLGIVAENPPVQREAAPTPSDAVPKRLIETLVLLPLTVKRTGDGVPNSRSEQDCPLE